MTNMLRPTRWQPEAPRPRLPGTPAWTEFIPSPYHSSRGNAAIQAVIFHFTAGPSLDGTVRYFTQNSRSVSAHYVVGKEGRTVQMVPLNRSARHAGTGALDGNPGVNARSIGIEIVNWGVLTQKAGGFLTHSGTAYRGAAPVSRPDADGRIRWWEPFTEEQYQALGRLTRDLLVMFPGIRWLTGHEDVALPVGRKNDPGPAFDWSRIRASIPGFTGHLGPIRRDPRAPSTARAPAPSTEGSAVVANRRYAKQLGWGSQYDAIVRALGFTNMTPGEDLFVQAVARWQTGRGLGSDGILGPRTWAALRPLLANTGPRLAPAVGGAPTPSAPRYGLLRVLAPGRDPINYRFTREDATWLARMLIGEASGGDTPENHGVTWAMFNRYALLIAPSARYRKVYPTFHQFIRAYSTPLQPCLRSARAAARHYARPGAGYVACVGRGNYPGTNIPIGQLQRHLDLQRRPWETLPAETRSAVERAMNGQLSNPIGAATEFANTAVYYRQKHSLRSSSGRPTPDEWRSYTRAFAGRKKWEWIGPVAGLSEQSQMRHNAFFRQVRLNDVGEGAVTVIP
ncbi:MAG: N-acetylmuramoyl-L-alanine amidase [Gemmatimonadales bacterium]